ncbi:hypothetical protein BDP55DRAFT_647592 [Colletotrichum godetiae]|uniref:C2H2-type domain-containing protein n=1 Tax=Colletotrichum godetiae TaxID=1209918 RepID=A0AAJ0AZ27_9PEZI|nr:uncharacterized protein BDP55DRAFT_647592 [Colletotrichum godetiae]KAK1691636.1 hypothetical protein BDP55DRAFT_647592 [Colletotrichum godetiae]
MLKYCIKSALSISERANSQRSWISKVSAGYRCLHSTCISTTKIFGGNRQIEVHIQRHHLPKQFICHTCGGQYGEIDLKYHRRVWGGRTVQCSSTN